MKQWHYGNDDQPHGPISDAELLQLLKTGQLPPTTPIWTPGMETWSPANQVDSLGRSPLSHSPSPPPKPAPTQSPASAQQNLPQPAPASQASPNPSTPAATRPSTSTRDSPEPPTSPHPWLRYFARMFDLFAFTAIAGTFVVILYPAAFQLPELMFNALMVAGYALAEAAMLPSWGTTPGKALLGVTLRNRNGSKLTFEQALARSFKVAIKGVGLAIPLVSLFTHITAYNRLNNTGVTSWDEEGRFEVHHQPVGSGRLIVFALLLLAIFALVVWGVWLNQDYLDQLAA